MAIVASNVRATALRAALYCRVSTLDQEQDGTSLDSQEAAGRGHAGVLGASIVAVYREVYTGANLWDRPKLTELRELIRHRVVDIVIIYALDRLSRDQAHIFIVMDEAERHGVQLKFVTEVFDASPVGKM